MDPMQPVKYQFKLTDADVLEESPVSVFDLIVQAHQEATKRGIKVNSIVINKNMVHVPEMYGQWPEMVCGLHAYWTDKELPDGYTFSVQHAPQHGKPDDSVEARPIDEWGEDMGDVLWWQFPIVEPPYVGSPLDAEWPGYHTHWTPIPIPKEPGEDYG